MYNVAWYLISNTIISVAVVILVEYGFVQTKKSHFVHFRQMCIDLLHNNLSLDRQYKLRKGMIVFVLFFFPVLWWSKNSWTVKIKVTSYSFQKIIIPKSLSFCYGVFYCLQKNFLNFQRELYR